MNRTPCYGGGLMQLVTPSRGHRFLPGSISPRVVWHSDRLDGRAAQSNGLYHTAQVGRSPAVWACVSHSMMLTAIKSPSDAFLRMHSWREATRDCIYSGFFFFFLKRNAASDKKKSVSTGCARQTLCPAGPGHPLRLHPDTNGKGEHAKHVISP